MSRATDAYDAAFSRRGLRSPLLHAQTFACISRAMIAVSCRDPSLLVMKVRHWSA